MIFKHKTSFKVALTVVLLTSILGGCTGNYTFESNVKADNAEEYFSASKVKIYDNEQAFDANYQYVGLVEVKIAKRNNTLLRPMQLTHVHKQGKPLIYKKPMPLFLPVALI
jgi:RcsF protein